MTIEEGLKRIQDMRFQIERVDRVGGRDSFFGMMEIFEIILKEEHDKDNETGMYRFKGMEQYGNIVSIPRIYDTVDRCVKELKYTKDELDRLIKWYDGRETPDTKVLALVMGWAIKDKKYFV